MNINTESQKALQKRLSEMAKTARADYKEAFDGAKLGQAQPNDAQFKMWFEMRANPLTPMGQVNPYFNPNFVRALEFIEGGKAILRRYERIQNPPPPKADPLDALIAEVAHA